MNVAVATDCCGGRCRWCDEWRTAEHEKRCGADLAATIAKPADEPATMWCEGCQATVYVDAKSECAACGGGE